MTEEVLQSAIIDAEHPNVKALLQGKEQIRVLRGDPKLFFVSTGDAIALALANVRGLLDYSTLLVSRGSDAIMWGRELFRYYNSHSDSYFKRAVHVFTLEHCKRMWKYLTVHMAKLLGDTDPPKCPAPWLNLPTLVELCNDIVDSLGTVEMKEEFADLIWSWENYVNRLNKRFSLVFPWHLGLGFPRRRQEEINEMGRLSRIWEKQ